jgi:hypothetical protein
MKRRPAMKKISTMQAFSNEILKEQKLTIGMDLGDSWSFYCVLDEAGKIILEQKVATTQEAMIVEQNLLCERSDVWYFVHNYEAGVRPASFF